jgi:hypothetical protein
MEPQAFNSLLLTIAFEREIDTRNINLSAMSRSEQIKLMMGMLALPKVKE